MELRKLKVKSIKRLESTKVHDLSVNEVQHYITENGVINHNSGREYGASIILMMTKAKLNNKKEGEQVGIILTAKPNKNRFAKPNVVKTHLDYKTGLNEFTGLQDYIQWGWEDHGIEKGTIITEKELKKKGTGPKSKAVEFKCVEDIENGIESLMYFIPEKNATTIAVKELGRHLTAKQFFSTLFWTQERLEAVDKFAAPLFNYGIDDDLPEDELFNVDHAEVDLDS